MALQKYGPRKQYLSIIQGSIRKYVAEDAKGAIKREYTLKDGTSGVKYEYIYESVSGRIERMEVLDKKFGEVLEIELDDEILSINTDSRYYSSFVKKIASADINRDVIIAPFDFEPDEGKRVVGVNIFQDDKKLENYYWDNETKKACNGMPLPDGDTTQYKSKDWQMYFIIVGKFLSSEVEKINANIKHESFEDMLKPNKDNNMTDVPEVSIEDIYSSENEEHKEINVNKIPF